MKSACAAGLAALLLVGCSKEREEPAPVVVEQAETSAAVQEAFRCIARFEWSRRVQASTEIFERRIDVRGMTALEFKETLASFPGEEVHVWMPGEKDWLLVGRRPAGRVSLAEAMETFAADTNCTMSVAEVFASYVGTREDVMPAFAAKLDGEVLPQWFVTKEIPALDWLDLSDVDEDILAPLRQEIRSVQVLRRELLKGNMLAAKATDKQGEEAATAVWAKVALRNPNDPMLLERIDRLSRNAKGFLEVGRVLQALKCYETIVLIQPKNAAAVYNFGMCLKKIGKLDMAEKVLERAKRLREI